MTRRNNPPVIDIDELRNNLLRTNEVLEEVRQFVTAQRHALEKDGFSPTAAETMAAVLGTAAGIGDTQRVVIVGSLRKDVCHGEGFSQGVPR